MSPSSHLSICFLCLFLLSTFVACKQTVIIEAFDWDSLSNRTALYPKIQSAAAGLAAAGVTHVWFPPPSQSADQQGYMPGQWYNIVGSSQLLSAINTVINKGMQPLMDTVLNHRTATYKSTCDNNWNNFTNPNWGTWAVVRNDYECSSSQTFCSGSCQCGNSDTGQNFCPAPDVDHTNTGVQNDIISWMKWMQQNYKFVGWRFDMVIGYGGQYVGKYVSSTNTQYSVGEYWTDDTSAIVNWIQATGSKSQAFDFPNRDTLQSCVDSNDYTKLLSGISPPGLMGADPNYAATFTDNHDTARDDRFGNTDQIIQGYAYLFTHPGTPFIFWDDWNTAQIQSAITEFIKIRNTQNLTPTQKIYVTNHEKGLYSVFLGGATSDCGGNTCMKLGTNSWDPNYCGSTWKLATSGNNYAIWTK